MQKKAVDVSAWQGIINWQNVRLDGIEAAILRAGYGQNGIDKQFHRNAAECQKNGIEVASYWFLYSLNVEAAKREAEYAAAAVGMHSKGCAIFADLEYDSIDYARKKGVSIGGTEATAQVAAFCKRVAELGFVPGVYTNIDYLKRYFDMGAIRAAAPGVKLWIASWSNAKTPPSGYGPVDAWQYSSKGRVNGISGDVDMDYLYGEFGGVGGGESNGTAGTADASVNPAPYVFGGVNYALVFDPDYYARKHEDVAAAVSSFAEGDRNAKLFEHFLYCGMNEHRQGNSDFDPTAYRMKYSDLERAFGNEWKKYYDHYCLYGKKEIESGKRSA